MEELDFNIHVEPHSMMDIPSHRQSVAGTKPRKHRRYKFREIEKQLEELRLKRELEDIFERY